MDEHFTTAMLGFTKALTESYEEWFLAAGGKKGMTEYGYTEGREFCRVFSIHCFDGRPRWPTAHAFVALEDGHSRTLGSWKKGDIFYSASWKQPAKHVRGNIFQDHGRAAINATGQVRALR
jgi:hypothetical protein